MVAQFVVPLIAVGMTELENLLTSFKIVGAILTAFNGGLAVLTWIGKGKADRAAREAKQTEIEISDKLATVAEEHKNQDHLRFLLQQHQADFIGCRDDTEILAQVRNMIGNEIVADSAGANWILSPTFNRTNLVWVIDQMGIFDNLERQENRNLYVKVLNRIKFSPISHELLQGCFKLLEDRIQSEMNAGRFHEAEIMRVRQQLGLDPEA